MSTVLQCLFIIQSGDAESNNQDFKVLLQYCNMLKKIQLPQSIPTKIIHVPDKQNKRL